MEERRRHTDFSLEMALHQCGTWQWACTQDKFCVLFWLGLQLNISVLVSTSSKRKREVLVCIEFTWIC